MGNIEGVSLLTELEKLYAQPTRSESGSLSNIWRSVAQNQGQVNLVLGRLRRVARSRSSLNDTCGVSPQDLSQGDPNWDAPFNYRGQSGPQPGQTPPQHVNPSSTVSAYTSKRRRLTSLSSSLPPERQ